MIAINLLPPEYRIQEKHEIKLSLGPYFILSFVIVCIVTGYFYFEYKKIQTAHAAMEKEWSTIEPQSLKLKQLESEVKQQLKPEADFLTGYVAAEDSLSALQAWASDYLPSKAWLLELRFIRNEDGPAFFIKGLALPSDGKNSIEIIDAYMNDLKSKLPNARLTLTTTRQIIDTTELTQFTANFDWTPEASSK